MRINHRHFTMGHIYIVNNRLFHVSGVRSFRIIPFFANFAFCKWKKELCLDIRIKKIIKTEMSDFNYKRYIRYRDAKFQLQKKYQISIIKFQLYIWIQQLQFSIVKLSFPPQRDNTITFIFHFVSHSFLHVCDVAFNFCTSFSYWIHGIFYFGCASYFWAMHEHWWPISTQLILQFV